MSDRLCRGSSAFIVACVAGLCFQASAQSLDLVSAVTPQLVPAGGAGDSSAPVVSFDGRFVLFASTANNLLLNASNASIPGGFPWSLNAFLRDRARQSTVLISSDLLGLSGGNADSVPLGISTNGRFALFQSQASNLVPPQADTNSTSDIFLRDVLQSATILVSVNTNGVAGNGASRDASMTPDGRFVAFVSEASDLASNDTNAIADVFVRDLQSGTTTLVSVGAMFTNTAVPMRSSEAPDITPDGRFVAFYSTATNLVPGVQSSGEIYLRDLVSQTTTWVSSGARAAALSVFGLSNVVSFNHAITADGAYVVYEASPVSSDVGIVLRYNLGNGSTEVIYTNAAVPFAPGYQYIHSLALTPDGRFITFLANNNLSSNQTTSVLLWDSTGSLTLVSGDSTGNVPTNSTCDWPAIDDSGRYVAFRSTATGLVTNETPGLYHIYLRDVQKGTTSLIDSDTNSMGSPVSAATVPSLSADGGVIAFDCGDSNLVPGDNNRDSDVFARDLLKSTTELISSHAPVLSSSTANGVSSVASGCASRDGRFVVFASEASNLVAGDTNGCRDIFVRDMQSGVTTLVSVSTNGSCGDGWCWEPSISADGRFVAFTSIADNLASGDTNMAQDVFVRDLIAGTTVLVSVNSTGTGSGDQASHFPILSADGQHVLFQSQATNLTPAAGMQGYWFYRDLRTGTTVSFPAAKASSAAMARDGRFVFYWYGSSQYARLWDEQEGGVGTNFTGIAAVFGSIPANAIYELSFSPDDSKLALVTVFSGLWVADTASPAAKPELIDSGAIGLISGLRWSEDSSQLVYSSGKQVWLHSFQSQTNILVSHAQNSSTAPAAGISDSEDISSDGRFVVFRSTGTNLVGSLRDSRPRVFLYDTQSAANTLLIEDVSDALSAVDRPLGPFFSPDGKTLYLASWSDGFGANDFNQNGDLFAYSLFYASLTPAQGSDQTVTISWPSATGKRYKVQFRDGFNDPAWHDLPGPITTGEKTAFTHDTAPTAQRLYRIVSF